MGLLSETLGESRTITVQDFIGRFKTGLKSAAGININAKNALSYPPVISAVKILSKTVASLPLKTFQKQDRGKQELNNHRLTTLLGREPNPEMTAFTYREAMMGHLALWGNHYAEIQRNGRGEVVNLWPLPPKDVVIKRSKDTNELEYNVKNGDGRSLLQQEDVLHIKGFGFNGIRGFGLIELNSDTVGLGKAQQQYASKFYENDSTPGGFLSFPEGLSEEAQKRISESWEDAHKGLDDSHRVAVLEEGATWEQTGMPPETAELIEQRQFQVDDIARIFDMPPHRLARLSNSNFSNVEQQSLDFVKHTIRPWLVKIEQEYNKNLLTDGDKDRDIFVEHIIEGLLRGDSEARAEFYNAGVNNGWLSINEVRQKENLNPIDGGDENLRPLNLTTVEGGDPEPQNPTESEEPPEENDSVPLESEYQVRDKVKNISQRNGIPLDTARSVETRRRVTRSHQTLFEEQLKRIVSRETQDVREIIENNLDRRDVNSLRSELGEFYWENHVDFVEEVFGGPMRSLGSAIVEETAAEIGMDPAEVNQEEFFNNHVENEARNYAGDSYGQLIALIRQNGDDETQLRESLEGRVDEWEEKRADKEAPDRTWDTSNESTLTTFQAGNVSRKVWTTVGGNCPLCNSMAGRTVDVGGAFLSEGDTLSPDGTSPFTASSSVPRPKLHNSCDCLLAPA